MNARTDKHLQLTTIAARVIRENPHLDAESVQAGVSAALEEVCTLVFERQARWQAREDGTSKAREREAQVFGQLVFQLHSG